MSVAKPSARWGYARRALHLIDWIVTAGYPGHGCHGDDRCSSGGAALRAAPVFRLGRRIVAAVVRVVDLSCHSARYQARFAHQHRVADRMATG